MTRHVNITIEGFLVGPIWQGIEGYQTLNYSVTAQQARRRARLSLREHVLLALTLHGQDFISCAIGAGTLHIDVTTINASGFGATRRRNTERRTVSKMWELDHFPSISDLLHPDADWLPPVETTFYEES